jgi:hypothetical protein
VKRVVSPTHRLKEVDSVYPGVRYTPDKNGVYTVSDRDAKALIAYGGFVQPDMGMGRRSEGYRCQTCGFGSWFKRCSRCGTETCTREA